MRCAERAAAPGLALLLGCALALATGCQRPAPAAQIPERMGALGHPDIVLIVVDTLRADWTTPYGFAKDTTPELARWAARGVLFEHVLSQSSWTKMSVASLMTSLWPQTHAIREAKDGLADGAVTLAEALQGAGYATYAVQTNGWLHQSFGFHQGFDRYVFPVGSGQAALASEKPSLWAHADRVVEEAKRVLGARDARRPLFLYLHFMDVHEYAAPPEFQTFGNDAPGQYQSAERWVDDAVARVREAVADAGSLDRTLMVLASDHGEAFGEQGVHGHARNVLMPVLRVPLVIRLPFPIQPVRVAAQVRNLDIAPTLLDLAGVPVPPSFEGRSLLPLILGQPDPEPRVSFAQLGVPLFPDSSVQVAVHEPDWTYARNAPADPKRPDGYEAHALAPGAEFLFDRSVDPGENVNLIGIEPGQAARLRAELDAHLATAPAADVREQGVRIDPGIAEKLRAMGYLR